ncbi:hypothetical protein TRAPUB_8544 [Trametes pubescens]|uniref:Uncharacterized protein n=1 Tax=Trametes pubescens TaxID=154538 RepID=A0A1M2W4U5_TRAPU|nr:hypothetical protein TRAPUB_8544 [Trametes pubescens]
MLATGSSDPSSAIWDTSNQTIIHKWDAHTEVVWALDFSPNDKRLASASADGNVMM